MILGRGQYGFEVKQRFPNGRPLRKQLDGDNILLMSCPQPESAVFVQIECRVA